MLIQVLALQAAAALMRLGAPNRGRVAAQHGQSMVEYAITLALIAVVAMAAVQALGGGIAAVFGRILGKIVGIG